MQHEDHTAPPLDSPEHLPPGIILRPFQVQDGAGVRRLVTVSFEAVSIAGLLDQRWGSHVFPLSWAERKWRDVASDLEAHGSHCLIAVDSSGAIVGCVTAQVDVHASIGRIPDLMVDPAHRGQGVGRALLAAVLAHFSALGLVAAKIETLSHNEVGAHLYPSLGFELIATQFHYVRLLAPPGAAPG